VLVHDQVVFRQGPVALGLPAVCLFRRKLGVLRTLDITAGAELGVRPPVRPE